jgi:hypothetical protein
MVLGDLGRARRLAGNPAISNVSDADITQGLTYGTSRVFSITGKTDWETDTSHPNYPAVVMAAEYYASSMIRDRFQDQSDISTEHYIRAREILTEVVTSLAAGSTGGLIAASASRAYRSYPKNPEAMQYRSMLSPGQTLVGVAGPDWYMYNEI